MPSKRQAFGKKGEAAAAAFLRRRGYRILEFNHRNRIGEIDIIAEDDDTLVFVEVKAKQSARHLHPKYAVNRQKQKKISMAALYYLKATRQTGSRARFDVVTLVSGSDPPQIELIKNAFDLAYP
jgi:putative endonuclease